MIEIKNRDAIVIFQDILFNRNDNSLIFNPRNNTFSDTEIEYQMRDFSNHDFSSLLVRFCDDKTHTYREFFSCDYDNIYDLIYDALSDETTEWLIYHSQAR